MTNPYEVTSNLSTTARSPWRYALVLIGGVFGYCTLIVALGLTALLSNGWSAALDNLGRVVRIHRELSLNTIAAFASNLVLAILVAVATKKWVDAHVSQSRWWLLSGITVIGYIVVLLSTGNLIPWTWSSELSNAVRSTLTLLFPLVAYAFFCLFDLRTIR
jgi:hypothetical protein